MKNITIGEWQFNKNFEVDSSDRMVFRVSTENEVSRIEYEANKKLFENSREVFQNMVRLIERLEENDLGQLYAVKQAKELIKKIS